MNPHSHPGAPYLPKQELVRAMDAVDQFFEVADQAMSTGPQLRRTSTAEFLIFTGQAGEVKAAMLKAGAEPTWANAPSMAAFMQADTAQWKKVAAFAKISLE